MRTYRVNLIPKGNISGFPSSDTLFGTIMWGIREVYGEGILNKYLQKFKDKNGEPPFVISSSFPFLKGNKEILFFPKPILSALSHKKLEEIGKRAFKPNEFEKKYLVGTIEVYKKFKKARFVSEFVFGEILEGTNEDSLFQEYLIKEIVLSQIGELKSTAIYGNKIKVVYNYIMKEKEFREIFGKGVYKPTELGLILRNTIDRLSGSTVSEGGLFYTEEIFARKEGFGLYFLIRTNEPKDFIPVLKYLNDTGIGRDRSIGRNQFEVSEPLESDIKLDANGEDFVTLSRYIPQSGEVVLPPPKDMYYEVLPVRSKIESRREFAGEGIWKSPVIYFAEGSVLKLVNPSTHKLFYGRAPCVKKIAGKEILQNGFCIPAFRRGVDETYS